MLSKGKIIEAIQNKDIEISVSYVYEDNDLKFKNQTFLQSPLSNNLYSDRLKLTMGPIVKVMDKAIIKRKYRFKTFRNCHDLIKSNNKYIIKSGESIIVLTNEKIKLKGNYACLILPRISLSDVGIVVTPAYVDPYYNGVLRLHLTNFSNKAYELTALEPIAQCFFFKLSDAASDIFQMEFPQKSVFFGQTWDGINNSDRDPFPTKKESASIDRFSNVRYQMGILLSFIKKHSLLFMLLANILVLLTGYAKFEQSYTRYKTTVEQVETILQPTAIEIVIEPGEKYGEKEIMIDCAKADILSIICNNDEVHYKILSGDVENETRIVFSYSLSSVLEDRYEMNFTYTVVRRIQE